MNKIHYYIVGIEKLGGDFNLPTEHIDSWEEEDLEVAMTRYESIEIDSHSAKYLMAITYDEEEIAEGDVRTVLHLHPALAPVKAAVLPLSKKLSEQAEEVYAELAKYYRVDFDETGSIGKRYRRQDEIGTPYCITYDFDSIEDGCVTVRERDSMEQVRLPIAELKAYLDEKLYF